MSIRDCAVIRSWPLLDCSIEPSSRSERMSGKMTSEPNAEGGYPVIFGISSQ